MSKRESKMPHNGFAYDKSSQTQFEQGTRLLDQIMFRDGMKILDVGCGNGQITLELFNRNKTCKIDAFDISASQIEVAKKRRNEKSISPENVNFYVMNALELEGEQEYDLVFSNATMHWITESEKMYSLLHKVLKPGGQLAVHQGGKGSYAGLHAAVKQAIINLKYEKFYEGWEYPIFYPSRDELEVLLEGLGFEGVTVFSLKSDGSEHKDLVDNFTNAGLLPYLDRLQLFNKMILTNEYVRLCNNYKINTHSHRLYVNAHRGD